MSPCFGTNSTTLRSFALAWVLVGATVDSVLISGRSVRQMGETTPLALSGDERGRLETAAGGGAARGRELVAPRLAPEVAPRPHG